MEQGINFGGNLAHLGGALMGYLYTTQLNKGNEMGKWVFYTMDWFKGLFKKKPKIKVSHKSSTFGKTSTKQKSKPSSQNPHGQQDVSQEEIDKILDKIAEKGYESLSKEEKQKLFNASKK